MRWADLNSAPTGVGSGLWIPDQVRNDGGIAIPTAYLSIRSLICDSGCLFVIPAEAGIQIPSFGPGSERSRTRRVCLAIRRADFKSAPTGVGSGLWIPDQVRNDGRIAIPTAYLSIRSLICDSGCLFVIPAEAGIQTPSFGPGSERSQTRRVCLAMRWADLNSAPTGVGSGLWIPDQVRNDGGLPCW